MKHQTHLGSTDGITTLNCLKWSPDTTEQPRAVLQLIHGMAEYIERYAAFADFLTAQNIVVVGHDHLGHGQSVNQEAPRYGYFSKKNSSIFLVEDAYQITVATQAEYPGVPYFILGHSMGSFVLRNYLADYSEGLAGAIIMGTGGRHPELKAALSLTALLNKVAPTRPNPLLDKIAFGGFAKRFPEKRSNVDWLSKDPLNVDAYLADPLLGFVFTNNGFHTLFTLMYHATKTNWWDGISRNLALLVISGEQDPVGDFGKGPREVASQLAEAEFKHVTLQLYASLRHELLNEAENESVASDIYQWLEKQLDAQVVR